MSYRTQEKVKTRFLSQVDRKDPMPQLVSIHQVSKLANRNTLLQQARRSNRPQSDYAIQKKSQTEFAQNIKLKDEIKELSKELIKLKQVNQNLLNRMREIQVSYRNLQGQLQREKPDDIRKFKLSLYAQIEQYLKLTVQQLAMSLRNQKMTPTIQNKLEKFMAQLIQINPVSVQQTLRRVTLVQNSNLFSGNTNNINVINPNNMLIGSHQYNLNENEQQRRIQDENLSPYQTKNKLPTKQHYASIMERLGGDARMSKSYAVGASHQTKLRTIYATTPQKRRKIFD